MVAPDARVLRANGVQFGGRFGRIGHVFDFVREHTRKRKRVAVGVVSSDSSSSNPPPPQRIIINKDTRTFREKMCARTCKKFPTRRPTTTEEELESGWEPFDEDAFTEKKRAQRKEDEAYRQAHKLVEDLTSGRGDGGEL